MSTHTSGPLVAHTSLGLRAGPTAPLSNTIAPKHASAMTIPDLRTGLLCPRFSRTLQSMVSRLAGQVKRARPAAKCAWQDSNLRPCAPEAHALSPELQARRVVVYRP